MKFKVLLTVASAYMLTGCASVPPTTVYSERLTRTIQSYQSKKEIERLPEINKVLTAEIGESLIAEGIKYTEPALEVTAPFNTYTSNAGRDFGMSVSPGKFTIKGTDADGKFYQSVTSEIQINSTPARNLNFGVYVTNNEPKRAEVYLLADDGRPLNYPASDLKYKEYIDLSTTSTAFRKELVYTGVSKNVISIVYREFSDNIARPAFTQELKYDLGEGKVFGFKGARFEVIKATNTGLTYKAVSHLH